MGENMAKNLEEIKAEVVRAGGLRTYPMRDVRDAAGIVKLGGVNVKQISEDLADLGLAHFPNPLPTNQDGRARLYVKGTPVGKVIDAAVNLSDKNDTYLRNVADNSGSEEIIKRIRALVCE